MANLPPDPPRSLRGAPHNPGLQKLIEAKREWHYRPTLEDLRRGFRGWYERGYLPHFDAPNVTQIVTYMLRDAFPVWRRREWEPILKESDLSLRRRKLEAWLDRGHGECWLRQPVIAQLSEHALLHFDGQRYLLLAWCVMPNHVHAMIETREGFPLPDIVHSWKSFTANRANKMLRRRGEFWQREYWDHYIRNAEHYEQAFAYIEGNPVKAGLARVKTDWPWSSARFRQAGSTGILPTG